MAAPAHKSSKLAKSKSGASGSRGGGGVASGSSLGFAALTGGGGLGEGSKSPSKNRAPLPALFLNPSPQASQVNIAAIHEHDTAGTGGGITSPTPSTTTTNSAPLVSTVATTKNIKSAAVAAPGRDPPVPTTVPALSAREFASPNTATAAASAPNPDRTVPTFAVAPSAHYTPCTPSISSIASTPLNTARSADRTDALWAEMQATLEEVEFSASGSTHVFRAEHDKKLSELRAAQIALAQAWARSEADEPDATSAANGDGPVAGVIGSAGGEGRNFNVPVAEGSADKASKKAATGPRPRSSGSAGPKGVTGGLDHMDRMEEETEADILLAAKRREANDKYFRRVNQGVIDVVSKLVHVADAMRKVEAESKDIWGENESGDSGESGK